MHIFQQYTYPPYIISSFTGKSLHMPGTIGSGLGILMTFIHNDSALFSLYKARFFSVLFSLKKSPLERKLKKTSEHYLGLRFSSYTLRFSSSGRRSDHSHPPTTTRSSF